MWHQVIFVVLANTWSVSLLLEPKFKELVGGWNVSDGLLVLQNALKARLLFKHFFTFIGLIRCALA